MAHRYEYMELTPGDAPELDAPRLSNAQGAGRLGFTGTVHADRQGRGLIHRPTADLVSDDAPLLPGTWDQTDG
ncbi:hypothetical protein [Mycobacterium stomatepiae]|uniref:Uncharacterized protein n=1 Tax=Mycobacterium stomatepiae TaxID=470076 RepID=A0A7I7QHW2_9MYCO|nr:hypothetical protein [Mycobacterium stomatepiae]MCV7166161.1 hypothetical protein [Mycobacterium stomatepiae]BBY25657.1 hypothetical protein MSTO_58620 [Mycobacterium stomatepiae]